MATWPSLRSDHGTGAPGKPRCPHRGIVQSRDARVAAGEQALIRSFPPRGRGGLL
jgi:hypothetical protein